MAGHIDGLGGLLWGGLSASSPSSDNLTSSQVAYMGTIYADQFNRFRDDLLKHHDHSSGQGYPIGHDKLTDGRLAFLSHLEISEHIQAAGTDADPDVSGGSSGVHGLDSADYYVASIIERGGMAVQIGAGTCNRNNSDYGEQRGRGTFGTEFAEPPIVFVSATVGESCCITLYQTLSTSFAARFRFYPGSAYYSTDPAADPSWATFNWIAIGLLP